VTTETVAYVALFLSIIAILISIFWRR